MFFFLNKNIELLDNKNFTCIHDWNDKIISL